MERIPTYRLAGQERGAIAQAWIMTGTCAAGARSAVGRSGTN